MTELEPATELGLPLELAHPWLPRGQLVSSYSIVVHGCRLNPVEMAMPDKQTVAARLSADPAVRAELLALGQAVTEGRAAPARAARDLIDRLSQPPA